MDQGEINVLIRLGVLTHSHLRARKEDWPRLFISPRPEFFLSPSIAIRLFFSFLFFVSECRELFKALFVFFFHFLLFCSSEIINCISKKVTR